MTAQELIKKYNIVIAEKNGEKGIVVRNTTALKRDNAFDVIKSAKTEIMAWIEREAEEKIKAADARQAKIDAIPGLSEIKKAIDTMDNYRLDFDRAFEDENGVYPTMPDVNIRKMLSEYPHAAAYLEAENNSLSYNDEISLIGRKALEKVIDGDYQSAIATMRKELKAFTTKHIWD